MWTFVAKNFAVFAHRGSRAATTITALLGNLRCRLLVGHRTHPFGFVDAVRLSDALLMLTKAPVLQGLLLCSHVYRDATKCSFRELLGGSMAVACPHFLYQGGAAHNLGQIMQTLSGIGKPRQLQDRTRGLAACATRVSTPA